MRRIITFLKDPRAYLNEILNRPNPEAHQIVIVHLCEKGITANFGHCPNCTFAYEQISNGFAGHEVWVDPEFEGNLNWTKTLEWIAANLGDTPLAIKVFEGGSQKLPNSNVMMSLEELKQVMEVANVKAIVFPELISWYMNQTNSNAAIPINWIQSLFDFAIRSNLRIIWSEWKLGNDVEALTNSTLAGYEDKIIYIYQTNNQYQHPAIGLLYAMQFSNWGVSVQSWWVDEKTGEDRWDLPLQKVLEFAKLARNSGAQIIMTEPYWYFFDDNGKALEPMYALWEII